MGSLRRRNLFTLNTYDISKQFILYASATYNGKFFVRIFKLFAAPPRTALIIFHWCESYDRWPYDVAHNVAMSSHLQSLVVIVMYFLPLTSLARYSILAPTALLIQLINYEIRYSKSTPRSGKKAVFLLQFRYPVRLPVKNTRDALLFNQVISFSVCSGVTDNYCFYRPYTLHTAAVVCAE